MAVEQAGSDQPGDPGAAVLTRYALKGGELRSFFLIQIKGEGKKSKKWMSILMSAVMLLSGAKLGGYGSSKAFLAGGAPDWWTTGPLKTVYRTSFLPTNPNKSVELVSAVNEYESAQLAAFQMIIQCNYEQTASSTFECALLDCVLTSNKE